MESGCSLSIHCRRGLIETNCREGGIGYERQDRGIGANDETRN